MSKRLLNLIVVVVVCLMAAQTTTFFLPQTSVYAQKTLVTDCDDVRYLMENELTPYDLSINYGGGVLDNGVSSSSSIDGIQGDFWIFRVSRPPDRNAVNRIDIKF